MSVAFAQVQVRVRVMEASNVGSGFDSSLRDLHDQLGSLFSFSSYRLLKDETVSLSLNHPVSLPIPPERSLELTFINQHRVTAEIRVKITRGGKDLLTTLVRLAPGRSVSIGGLILNAAKVRSSPLSPARSYPGMTEYRNNGTLGKKTRSFLFLILC